MTEERAIKVLETELEENETPYKDHVEAVRLAIAALKNQATSKTNKTVGIVTKYNIDDKLFYKDLNEIVELKIIQINVGKGYIEYIGEYLHRNDPTFVLYGGLLNKVEKRQFAFYEEEVGLRMVFENFEDASKNKHGL